MINFLNKISENGILLDFVDGELSLFSKNENIDTSILKEIKDRKEDIISYLKEANDSEKESSEAIAIPVVSEEESYELSSSQYRLWVLSQFDQSSSAYHMISCEDLRGDYDIPSFRRAIDSVLERHEILRTVFREDSSGRLRQWVLPLCDLGFSISYQDYREFPDADLRVSQYVSEDSYKSFDLSNGPLLRASLLHVSDDHYVFYYNMHHIISDGWSMEILTRDIMHYYESYRSGLPVELSDLRIQFKDYSVWEQSRLRSGAYDNDKLFWLDKLSGELPLLDLPTQQLRPKVMTSNGEKLQGYLSKSVKGELVSFCHQQGGSLFMGLLAVWNILFYKYTSQRDIIIGTPVAGRDHSDLSDQIGFYVNTLALRNQVDPSLSFRDFYLELQSSTLLSYQHQMYPFGSLVEDLGLFRDTSRSAVFDVMVTLQNSDNHYDDFVLPADQESEIKYLGDTIPKFDLDIDFQEVGDCLFYDVAYNSDVYDRDMIEGMMGHFNLLVSSLLSTPDVRLDQVGYLSTKEEQLLLKDFGSRDVCYPKGETILDLFSSQVAAHPESIALVYENNSYTFRELDILSSQLSHCLLANYNLELEDFVGIKLDRSEWLVISVLGVLKAGCAYVPIDPLYPADRIAYIERDSNCKLTIDDSFLSGFNASDFSGVAPDIVLTPSNLVYMIYTSGSTGTPKGVMLEHGSLVNNSYGWRDSYGLEDMAVSHLQLASFSFDVFFGDFCRCIHNGGKLVISNDVLTMDFDDLYAVFKNHQISIVESTPALLVPFFQHLHSQNLRLDKLEVVVLGSDILMVNDLRFLLATYGDQITFINSYGLTESSIDSSYYKFDSSFDIDSCRQVSIGFPFPNTKIYILDSSFNLVPPGVVGELCLGGPGLARGYLNLSELTADRFVTNPFEDGERLYKTGDLAYWLADGSIGYIGRSDSQTKLNGRRIELGEIEYCLQLLEGVSEVSVLVKEGDSGDKFLVAYYVSSQEIDVSSFRRFLSDRLPEYMVPGYYVSMDVMPLTPNGKLDRKHLLGIDLSVFSSTVASVSPRTTEESVLVTALSSVLNRDSISVKDNFYNLGGDSIKSIQLASRLKQEGYRLKVDQILRTPVLEDLSLKMTRDLREVDQSSVSGSVMLSPIQHYFFNNATIRVRDHYNQSVLLKSSLPLDTTLLGDCFKSLVTHHDALRMVFDSSSEEVSQYNLDTTGVHYTLDYYDLREEQDELSAMELLGEQLQSSIDLSEGPLFKIGHFRLSDGDRLALIVHHLVIDGVSWRIILEDLSTLYTQYASGVSVSLPLKTDSYQLWSSLQHSYASGASLGSEFGYWNSVCDQTITCFPTDLDREDTTALTFDQSGSFLLDEDLTELLQTQVHNAYNTEINDILLTGLGLAIRDVFGETKSVIELEGHGREDILGDIDISRTVGWFTSIFPFVLDVTESDSLESSLVNVKEDLRGIPNKGLGYGMLKYLGSGLAKDLVTTIIFNYLGDIGSGSVGSDDASMFSYSSESIGSDIAVSNGEDALLDVSGMMVSGQLRMSIGYSTLLFSKDTIDRLVSCYEDHLGRMIRSLSKEDTTCLTPSDMTFKGLTISELSAITSLGDIEDVYRLSPLQQGIYYHWLTDSSKTMYLEQMSYRLRAPGLDIDSVRKAYQGLVNRYSILRTSFTNNYAGTLLQVVHKSVSDNFKYEKVSGEYNDSEVASYISEVKELDRSRGFDLIDDHSQMRLQVLDLGDDSYEFIWSHHHILMDGWCMSIVINDFYQLLESITTGKAVGFSTPILYSTYIEWLDGLDQTSSLEYWQEYLSGYESVASIPFVNADADKSSRIYTQEDLVLEGSVFESINNLCGDLNITQNTFIQGVWGYLLSRYNNTNDVVYGLVVSGRPGDVSGVEDMVGLFINTIPVRIQYELDETPKDLLTRLQSESISSNEHHYLELSRVQSQSDLGMDLINHILIFENYPVQDLVKNDVGSRETEEGQELIIESFDTYDETNYDFDILVAPTSSSLSVNFRYDAIKYGEESIKALVNHFQNLVEAFVSNSNQSLGSIDYLSKEEKDILLEDFNATDFSYPRDSSLIDLFRDQVNLSPDSPALIFGDRELSYKELDDLSSQFSHYLLSVYDISLEDVVGICLPKSEWQIISLLGVLKAGGAYVPIDPHYPSDRILYIEQDSGCSFVIDDSVIAAFNDSGDFSSSLPNVDIGPNNLGYIMYTSGSTGTPKGVMVEQRSIVRLVKSSNFYEFRDSDVLLSTGSFSFDATTFEYWGPLLNGSCLVLCSQSTLLDSNLLRKEISSRKVNVMWFTAGWLHQLVDTDIGLFKDLSTVIVGGDKLSPLHIGKLRDEYSDLEMINGYGPTENTTFSLTYNISDVSGDIPIGYPISNSSAYILDDRGSLVPLGVVGELCLGGDGLSRGYLNQPDLTRDKFISHPFDSTDRLYKTGDLGCWLPDGSIAFKGRKDAQVKIRGYRIELGEIEHVLLSESIIDQAVVQVSTISGSKFIVAYVVSSSVIDKKSLQDCLRDKLPEYMLPSYYVILDSLPLTSNGKVDHRGLPSVLESDMIKEDYVGPRTDQERVLVAVWEEVLQRREISVKDSFYNLGGDSIKSIQVVSRLKQQGYSLKVDQLLRHSVLEDLCQFLDKNTREIDQSSVVGNVGLTPIQHYFFNDPSISDLNHFNQSVLLRSDSALSEDLLILSLDALVSHHDALRMIYTKEGGDWHQFNQPVSNQHYSFVSYDLREESSALTVMGSLCQDLQSSIDLSHGPLLKVAHFRLADGDRLALIVHHLVVDGVSWRILLEDLSTLYRGYLQEDSVVLPLKTDSFQQWSSLQADYAISNDMVLEHSYWDKVCSGTYPELVVDNESSESVIQLTGTEGFVLDKDLTELLQTRVHGVYNTEINDLLLTSLGLALRDVLGLDQSVLKMEGHGREDLDESIDITRTVGWFTSIYPFVLDVSGADSSVSSLIQVKESLRKVPNKGIGYGMLKHLGSGFSKDLSPGIVFNYLGDFGRSAGGSRDSVFEYCSEYIGEEVADSTGTDTLLSVSGMLVLDELNISIGYSESHYNASTIEKLCCSYKDHLRFLIESLSIEEINYITPSDLTFKGLEVEELSSINKDFNVEDVYPLSPLQEGMYFHWLSDNSTSLYFEQLSYRLRSDSLDMSSVAQAYKALIVRHPVLRTSFTNDYGGLPLQVVRNDVEGFFSYDELPEGEDVSSYVEKVKLLDRDRGFDLESSSQMRLQVLDVGSGLYEFIWSFHHILMDGWCISILINDFYELLDSSQNTRVSVLPEVTPYSNYIEWLSEVDKEASLSYWRDYLSGYSSLSEVPFKLDSGVEGPEYRLGLETITISGDLYSSLDRLCQGIGITQNIFIQGVWGYLLSRYNDSQDVVFGSVVSGRPGDLSGVEDMIGLFINAIPVRVRYELEDSPRALLGSLHSEALLGNSHHYLNLSEVQDQSSLGMDLLEQLLIFENYPVQEALQGDISQSDPGVSSGLSIESVDVFEQTNYDFNIVVVPSSDSLTIEFRYNSSVYDDAQIKSLGSHFLNLSRDFCLTPDVELSKLDYLSISERSELLDTFNDTSVAYNDQVTFVDIFESQLSASSADVAISCSGRSLTYKEVDVLSNKLAHYLSTTFSIEKGSVIGIQLDRDEWLMVSVLAVFKLGCAFLPMDPLYPSERVDFIISDSNCSQVIDIDLLSGFKLLQEELPTTYDRVICKSSDLAYIIYTSGSTGTPKGVMIEHLGMLNHMYSKIEGLEFNKDSIVSQNSPFTFDISIWQLLTGLLVGARVVVYDQSVVLDPDDFLSKISLDGITILEVVPSYLKSLLEVEEALESQYLGDLSYLLVTGEAVSSSLLDRWFISYPSLPVVNAYGPTEASDDITVFIMDKSPECSLVPVGKPIRNMQIYILDSQLRMCGKGVSGEICVSGVGVGRGYINRPDLTRDKFIESPLDSTQRLYKTGDIGRWLADGTLEFQGRIDDQVKIRGHRIELGEIEYQLQGKDGIDQAVVVAKVLDSGSTELIAYIVSESEQEPSDLIGYLLDRLPDYMVPGYYLELSSIPLTSNGKVDKKKLPLPESGVLSTGSVYVAPRTSVEEQLVAIWEDVLERTPIGVQDDFFTLGGNSIKAIKVINLIQGAFKIRLKVLQLFQDSTIEVLAKAIETITFEPVLSDSNEDNELIF